MSDPFLSGQKIVFHPMEKTDLPQIRAWINSSTYRKFSRSEFPMSAQKQEEWFANLSKSHDEIVFTVWSLETKQMIGDCGIYNINMPNRKAEIGYGIGDRRNYAKGYGSEIVHLLCQYAFLELNLNRVYARLIECNVGSQRVLEKNGFTPEGRLRADTFLDGQYWDSLVFGILKSEWQP